MRIAYVAPGYAPAIGGVERHVEEIARRAAAAGHDVVVLAPARGRHPRPETIDGVRVYRFRDLNRVGIYALPPGLFLAAGRLLRERDVVHAHGYHALAALAGLRARDAPLVFTPHYHGTGHSALARLAHVPYRPLGRALFTRARAIVCVSQSERRLVATDAPAVADRIEVIPNGVGAAAIRAAEPFPDADAVVLSVGRLEPYKQVDRLLAALPFAPEACRVVVIGTGPVAGALARQAEAAGIADRVLLTGRVSDDELHRWLRSASVVVSLSREEAFGLVLVEGLAAGAAVVASAIDAHREVLEGQSLAVTIPVDASPQAIGGAIGDAIALRRRPHAPPAVHDWDEVAARTLALYARVVGR